MESNIEEVIEMKNSFRNKFLKVSISIRVVPSKKYVDT